MIILGYFASLLIGISLGLLGGGGSILTLPVLVYLFDVSPTLATAYSLFIVGATSLVGAWPKHKEGLIHYRTAIVFGIPSIIAVFITRKIILPAIPSYLGSAGSVILTKDLLLMVLFALLMVAASVSMLRGRNSNEPSSDAVKSFHYPIIIMEGALVGLLTGLVGAGGGFLIIPALVILGKLPMKQAVGTSLLIIAAKSLIGFTGDLMSDKSMDWALLTSVTAAAVVGIFIGNALSRRVESADLKKGFGWFILVMGIYIILKESGLLPG